MKHKHHENLVKIANANGLYSCTMDVLGEIGLLSQEITRNYAENKTDENLKGNEIIAGTIAYVYNALGVFCIAFDIENMVQNNAEKLAEETVLRIEKNHFREVAKMVCKEEPKC